MISYLSQADRNALKGVALTRIDLNSEDDWRMNSVLPTLIFLREHAEKIVILSHRGRPNGFEKPLSLKRSSLKLGAKLKTDITFIPHFNFDDIKEEIDCASSGTIFMLENLRFMREEEENDDNFAKNLAGLGDYYVNDAFAVSHRENASVSAIAGHASANYGGMNFEEEIKNLSLITENPESPLVVVLGGAKAKDKLGIIKYLNDKADSFLIGGAAANVFLELKGIDINGSLRDTEDEDKEKFREILKNKKLILPVDWRDRDGKILDIGPETEKKFSLIISEAKTIVWSGPMGQFEDAEFENGSMAVAKSIAENIAAKKIAGGGETVALIRKSGLSEKFNFLSTGGGAMLDFLAGQKLPGIKALESK